MRIHILWFRRDLRLADNPALLAAAQDAQRLLCVYLHAPEDEAPWSPGAASHWWLHHSLKALDETLRGLGQRLVILRGPALARLPELAERLGAARIDWNRLYEPARMACDRAIKARLKAAGREVYSHNAALLNEPWQIATGTGAPYRVFTPYWRKACQTLEQAWPLAAPQVLPPPPELDGLEPLDLDALELLPRIGWELGFRQRWQPGEQASARRARDFIAAGLRDYGRRRELPAEDGSSALSAALHFGEVGPRQLVHWVREAHAGRLPAQAEPWLRELGWREFAHHVLYHFPHSSDQPLQPDWHDFPWLDEDPVALRAWQRGRTGIPMVDAGMRQLWTTGWMHNRVRMIVASFLTKNLGQHWLHGARWFWDTLVDADLANNSLGWQWAAGSGADAAPYFRIFNPVAQGERFDSAGEYIRRWVPELAGVIGPAVHAPWERAPSLASRSGYPRPIVDPKSSRAAALARYTAWRKT